MRVFLSLLFSLTLICNASSQTISPAGPENLCPGGIIPLTVLNPPAGVNTYQWLQGVSPTYTPIAGATAISYNVTIAGTYSVIITNAGIPDTIGAVLVISRPNPVAAFTSSPNNQCGNVPISFTNTSTGTGLSYSWNFGDPNSGANNLSTVAQPVHRFVGNPGNGTQTFTVTLTVTSVYGCTATTTGTVTISQVPDLTLGGPGATVYDNKKYFRKMICNF